MTNLFLCAVLYIHKRWIDIFYSPEQSRYHICTKSGIYPANADRYTVYCIFIAFFNECILFLCVDIIEREMQDYNNK